MYPALSVIAFTVLSGAGYGLAFFLALGGGNPADLSTKVAWGSALFLIGAGLLCSVLHLGNPQRAWRAFSQWRTSWLSREGCLAMITFIPLTLLAGMCIFTERWSAVLGVPAALLCVATVYCTGMIYGSLRSVVTWNTLLTPLSYLGFSASSGILLLGALSSGERVVGHNWIIVGAMATLFFAWYVKYLWARRSMFIGTGASSTETATGLGNLGHVRLLERPHSMGNYLTNEMGFRIARKHQALLWRIAALFGLFAPIVLLALSLALLPGQLWLIGGAALFHICGLFVERWLFFANARHAAMLYYDEMQTR